jgi:hypothetical protein
VAQRAFKAVRGKTIMAFCLTFLMIGCGETNHYPSAYLGTDACNLKWARDYWISQGRPVGFDPGRVLGPANVYFVYTNTVTITNRVLHCRFGARRSEWPAGVLAITDEGIMIWIRGRDGEITVSPDENGIER